MYDAVVIGGGILGCFAARNLRRWKISTLLLEAEADICGGITRANSAIVYAGYDNRPGSLKAELTVRGNAGFGALCQELEVPFHRCGSLLVTHAADAVPNLERKLENGQQNGVPGLRLLSGAEAEAMEPMLAPGVAAALYAPSTGTVNPWQLGIAACENALQNGAELRRNARVLALHRREGGYLVETTAGNFPCKTILNCAGLSADRVQALLFPPRIRLTLDGAEYLVLDSLARKPERVIFQQASACGKGITAIPCVEGNLLLSGVRKPLGIPWATTREGLEALKAAARALLPEVELDKVIRSFGAVRPNPTLEGGGGLHDFCIENPAPGFYSLIGVKTPGITCADGLTRRLAEQTARYLQAEPNPRFEPHRQAIPRGTGPVVCLCRQITREEILEAIRRGATTVEGVKRRVGIGLGRCQGSRCTDAVERLLEECHGGV